MASSAGDRFLRQLSAGNGDEGVCGGLQLDQQQYGGAGAGRRGSGGGRRSGPPPPRGATAPAPAAVGTA